MMPWRKQWSYQCIYGSVRFLFSPAQRSVWCDLLDLATLSRDPGIIAPGENQAYNHEYIAAILNIDIQLLEETLTICEKEKMISENGAGIAIVNWKKYQSEYQRQLPYREAKKQRDYGNQQKYGNMVASTEEDIKRIKEQRKKHDRQD